ncbi:GGDEF domain-containing protein [Shewanella donghaensis]|uniref:GGDEF domain-containing protein n=1 Tax=Shewanella donghaensis TaxID=238836 RepID=UPI00118427A6|nr:GGDEF domain-containing protein [Shewanella donghaensis]
MSTVHPKLIKDVIEQTPRAMVAMLIVSATFFLIFIKFIPFTILLTWFFLQLLLAMCRCYNAKMFALNLEKKDQSKLNSNETIFIVLNVYQAFMWTVSSVFLIIYAHQPFEFVGFILSIGIVTAATLSMSSLYRAYLFFFFSMITPQVAIMLYYGEYQHLALLAFIIIYIPATILLSKSMLNSRISSIEAHDELEKSAEEFRRLSIMDNLTNIYNRRYFFEVAKGIISMASREQNKVSLLMLDIDYFKDVNDHYGHQGGDFILVNLTNSIENLMRESDIFARVGGEEFAILLNYTSLNGAKVIAEKIRSTIDEKNFIYNNTSIEITVSIGIAEITDSVTTIDELYKKADVQLYLAKDNGRNKVFPV